MLHRKNTQIIKIINSTLIDLPAPSNISHFWNFGSLLGICLLSQTITGVFLAMHYSPNSLVAFESVIHTMRNVPVGWLVRITHANGASMFFLFMYIHISRGLYYKSYSQNVVWASGTVIFMLSMLTGFLGYVLPWGQMSYWGATVITNLLSAVPIVGTEMVKWVWGGFSVSSSTLNRFFSLHYLLPFVVFLVVAFHLLMLHEQKSTNPLGIQSSPDKLPFFPYFLLKDLVSLIFFCFLFFILNSQTPYALMDPDNFNPANPMLTPPHIQPEWYFLFAYAILRAIPNKLGGVLALLCSILALFTLKTSHMTYSSKSVSRILFWSFICNFIILTWLGMKPVETPLYELSTTSTFFYFAWFLC